MKLKTIYNSEISQDIKNLTQFKYQDKLTKKLDKLIGDFDQNILNEIVLWKVNRYAEFDEQTIAMLNTISNDEVLDEEKTKQMLKSLLNIDGVGLPMASSILRFKNPNVYQIIDQRVYRVIYEYDLPKRYQDDANIGLYLEYLKKLREVCDIHKIDFNKADRILYLFDKECNKDLPIKY